MSGNRADRRAASAALDSFQTVNQLSTKTRREFFRKAGLCLPVLGAGAKATGQKSVAEAPPQNVLLILIDDLRAELGCYGSTRVRTPHIDGLASSGLTFLRCYCQQAASSPSRTSLLTGLRPDTTRVYDDRTHFRRSAPNAVTLAEHFRRHGYTTTAFGKVFGSSLLVDRPSWSIAPWTAGGPAWRSAEGDALAEANWRKLQSGNWRVGRGESGASGSRGAGAGSVGPSDSWESTPSDGGDLPDAQTAQAAAAAVASLKGRRFLVTVGFERPRLPLVAPRRFFELYPRGTWGGPQSPEPPRDAPPFALQGSEEIRAYADIPAEGPIPETKARELIRAYRACVSFVDAQIGSLLAALEDSGLADSTIVVVAGVNGSHLGELGLWSKNSNYEAATHAPLVVRAPGQRNAGRRTAALVESVDLFPSLCSLCGIPRPDALEGSSWRGLFDDPKRLWKRAVFSQHPRSIPGVGPGMGYSMRTARHRYTEWSGIDSPYSTAELYDYKDSPNELRNIANRPEHGSLVNGLAHMLREGWQGSLPPPFLPVSSRA